jgi:hypothetical protein
MGFAKLTTKSQKKAVSSKVQELIDRYSKMRGEELRRRHNTWKEKTPAEETVDKRVYIPGGKF